MSAAFLLKTSLETIPASVPYLHAEPKIAEKWRKRLEAVPGFKIGIAWQGNPAYTFDSERSIPLKAFEPLALLPGVTLVNLQKGFGREQLAGFASRQRVVDWTAEMDNQAAFVDTAGLMNGLDLVITSDTSMAHLAGALGVPVWVALGVVPDWRWMMDRSDMPWYPTMRLFRQRERGNWKRVFEQIAQAVRARMDTPVQKTPNEINSWPPIAPEPSEGAEVCRGSQPILIEISPGELIDRITILQIKSERMTQADSLQKVRQELAALLECSHRCLARSAQLEQFQTELKRVNEELWEAEDILRNCEAKQQFDPQFVQVARSIYRLNDQRCSIKNAISALAGSPMTEVKCYAGGTGSAAQT